MSYLDDLYSDKQRYVALSGKVREVADNISSVIYKFDEPISNTRINFVIDGSSPLSNKLEKIKSGLVAKQNSLNGSVMSSINEKIDYYDREIRNEIERLEELERLKEEVLKKLKVSKEEDE